MIDITSSKLLILGLVALMVIGPKDLPALLRTIGKYMGIIKRHANDFRAQFDEAMRESELDQIKRDAESSMRDAEEKIRKQMSDVQAGVDPNTILGGDPFAEVKPALAIPGDPAAPATAAALAAEHAAATASPVPQAAAEPSPLPQAEHAPEALPAPTPAPTPVPVHTADGPRPTEKSGA